MTSKYFREPMKDPGGYITEQQFRDLVRFTINNRDKTLLYFLFYTGRRVSEVVRSIKVSDCDFRNNMILFTILKKKTPVNKWLGVDSEIMEMLKKYIEEYSLMENDFLFPINRFRVDQIIKNLGVKAGMEYVGKHKIHAHTLRHSYAVMIAKKVKDMYELGRLQNQLQHASITTTLYYFEHYNPGERKLIDIIKKD